MICPTCGFDNLPGSEECNRCHQDMTQLDRPTAHDKVELSLMEDPVGGLQPRAPVTLPTTATVRDAIETMLTHNVGIVLVTDTDGKLAGIFSERDLLTRVAGEGGDHATLPVTRFMTPNPATVTATNTLAFTVHKMDVGGYRHLPVLEEGRPVGVVSVRDVLRHIVRLCRTA